MPARLLRKEYERRGLIYLHLLLTELDWRISQVWNSLPLVHSVNIIWSCEIFCSAIKQNKILSYPSRLTLNENHLLNPVVKLFCNHHHHNHVQLKCIFPSQLFCPFPFFSLFVVACLFFSAEFCISIRFSIYRSDFQSTST